jgi:hypothetical protein
MPPFRRLLRATRATHTTPLLALLLLACNPEELTCTLRGDLTGLTVELSAMPVGPFTVDIVIPRSTPTLPVSYTYRCDGGQLCRTRTVIFPGLVASDFTVRVTTNLGVRETTPPRPVRYTDEFPNGPRCGPRSTTATVQAGIPE